MGTLQDAELRAAVRRAAKLNKRYLKAFEGGGRLPPMPQPSPEHYHIVYHVPKEELTIPHFRDIYVSSKDAYQRIHDVAQEAEPNVEWYEDGSIGIETTLHGRADLWWIIMSVAPCVASQCSSALARTKRKRQLILLPGDL